MKASVLRRRLLGGLFLSLVSMLAGQAPAQTFKTLHTFTSGNDVGTQGVTGLVLSGRTLYGITLSGGASNSGTVFAIGVDGTGFTNIYSFRGQNDGAVPWGNLVLSGNTLYGEAKFGGLSQEGTLFAVNIDGSGFRVLHTFSAPMPYTNIDGTHPSGGLTLSGDKLYGSAGSAGYFNWGNLFVLSTNGDGFTVLHNFTGIDDGYGGNSPLIISGNTLYGVANPNNDEGSVFAVNADGTNFKTLHSFAFGSNYGNPYGPLALSGNVLYDTSIGGGFSPTGSVFAVNTDGSGFKSLHSFHFQTELPVGGLTLSGDSLFGATDNDDGGTVFTLNTDGSGYRVLYSFSLASANSSGVYTNADGMNPYGFLWAGSTLYGVTEKGGTSGYGTIFSISVPPQLTLTPVGPNLTVTWPTNFTGYTLQSTTSLNSPEWTTNLSAPVTVNGQYTVTTSMLGTQQFFRLAQ